jgi:hypothetical protein
MVTLQEIRACQRVAPVAGNRGGVATRGLGSKGGSIHTQRLLPLRSRVCKQTRPPDLLGFTGGTPWIDI